MVEGQGSGASGFLRATIWRAEGGFKKEIGRGVQRILKQLLTVAIALYSANVGAIGIGDGQSVEERSEI
jgi:hypothetical protein